MQLFQKAKTEQTQSNSQILPVKLQKLKLFISNSDEELPLLTSDLQHRNQLATMLRMYFNDAELLIFTNHQSPQNYLKEQQFQRRIQSIFSQYLASNPQYAQHESQQQQHNQQQSEHQQENHTQQNHIQHQTQQSKNSNKHSPKSKFSEKSSPIKIDFIDFVQFWLTKDEEIKIFYEKYNEIVKDSVQVFRKSLYQHVSNKASKQNSQKSIKAQKTSNSHQKDNKTIIKKESIQNEVKQKQNVQQLQHHQDEKQNEFCQQNINSNERGYQQTFEESQKRQNMDEQNNITMQENSEYSPFPLEKSQHSERSVKSQIVQDQQPKDSFRYYLFKFYDLYCKKSINTIKNQEFHKLIHFYTSMNLTKFMMYCKDLKLLKIEKKITAKYLQTLFKSHENKDHVLEFDAFQTVVKDILQNAFNAQQVEIKGFIHLGVSDRPNFVEVMGRLGVNIPLKKVIFAKRDIQSLSRMVKSRTIQQQKNLKHSKLLKEASGAQYLKNGGYGHGYQSNWDSNKLHKDLFLNQKQRKQQKLLQNLTIPKLNKLQPSKQIDERLHDLVDEQYDPYLKRYQQKHNSSQYQSASNGVIKRMDERIQNVVKKIR